MVSTETFEIWRNRLGGYANSEMRPLECCEQQGAILHQFYYWRQRITKVESLNSISIYPIVLHSAKVIYCRTLTVKMSVFLNFQIEFILGKK